VQLPGGVTPACQNLPGLQLDRPKAQANVDAQKMDETAMAVGTWE